jgi:pyruvate-formate lyase-activating enzyme
MNNDSDFASDTAGAARRCAYCQNRAVQKRAVEHSISHFPHILIVTTQGWFCESCKQTSFDGDVLQFFERMANKLRAGDIDGFTSLGGDYFLTTYRPSRKGGPIPRSGA